MSLRVGIDTGGTFTDVIAIDEDSGRLIACKASSTPSDLSIGLLDSLHKALAAANIDKPVISQILHGSTIATNAMLEHKFEGLGLLVNNGFRHLIEIARQSVPDGYGNSLFWVKPPRLVPLHLVREIPGRILFNGDEQAPLDETAVLEAVAELVDLGVNCVAVCLLHSYANDAHERRVGELLAEHYPDLFYSLSSIVLPEYREYERAMTTLIDVMVKPHCKTYLDHAHDQICAETGDTPFLIMQSNGGVVSSATAGERPITMLLSGPAAGVLGAIHMANLAGYRDILTLDVGGTSTDVSLVEDLHPRTTSNSLIESYPVKTPMLDIVTVGTGGGSIAWTDRYEALKVGPQSSGADPGPVCYGRGGVKPTTTDACVVLGRLPDSLVGGELKLDASGSKSVYQKLGGQYKMSAEEVAAGVVEIATANMVHGIRQVTTTRGRDPRQYVLVSFGGAGGMFCCDVADFLGIETIISPPDPGNLSAFGLHVSDIKRDYIRTLVREQSTADHSEIENAWVELEQRGISDIREEGVPEDKVRIIRSADVRYVGEGHEIPVYVAEDRESESAIDYVWRAFHGEHQSTFGFDYQGEQSVEIVNLRVQAIGEAHRPTVRVDTKSVTELRPASKRKVYWKGTGWIECSIYNRADIPPERPIPGPLVCEEYGSTVVMPEGWVMKADKYRNLILEKYDDN